MALNPGLMVWRKKTCLKMWIADKVRLKTAGDTQEGERRRGEEIKRDKENRLPFSTLTDSYTASTPWSAERQSESCRTQEKVTFTHTHTHTHTQVAATAVGFHLIPLSSCVITALNSSPRREGAHPHRVFTDRSIWAWTRHSYGVLFGVKDTSKDQKESTDITC